MISISGYGQVAAAPNRDARCVVSVPVQMTISMNDVPEISLSDDIDTLFRLHYARLVRALTLVSGDRERAADAVQEAFVKAHLRWRKLQGYDDPVGWIRRVAINRLRDEHRRDARKRSAVERLERDAETEWARTAHDLGRNGELMRLLAGLPRQQRLCLALFYVDELSVAEVAAALKISDGAVKFHLHQGRERLRGQLPSPGGPRDV